MTAMRTFTVPAEAREDLRRVMAGEYFIPSLTGPVRTVLDIGANVGIFSAWASQQYPEAQIHAYEPHPPNLKMLDENMGWCDRVHVHRVGVRNHSGRDRLFFADSSLTPSYKGETEKSEETEVIDAASLPPADFVKIDTEGCEVEILRRMDLSQVKAIACEAHGNLDAAQIADYLTRERGFACVDRQMNDVLCMVMKFVRRDLLSAKQKTMLAVPYYGGTDASFFECLLRLMHAPPADICLEHCIGDSLVTRARNTLTETFLQSDCTDILMIDSDLVFGADQIQRILSHDVDIVGGFYPKKQDSNDVQWVCNSLTEPTETHPNGLNLLRYIGTGFLRVRRRVFEKMIEVHGDTIAYAPDHAQMTKAWDFWPVGVYHYPDGTSRYLSEDWFFCQRAMDCGFQVWGDPKIVLKHMGRAVYPLQNQMKHLMDTGQATRVN